MTRRMPPADWRERAEESVAKSHRIERLIPSVLLDSPVSLAGYAYACLVARVWGALWSTGRIERRGGLLVFRGLPRWAFPRGGVCVGDCFLTGDTDPDDRVLRHERVHKAQWRRFGLLMPVLYALSGYRPLRNRFEIEAGLADGNYVPRSLSDR